MSDTEIKVIRRATKLFLTQGFLKTTHRQIALCETDDKAYDLYYSAYRHPATFDYIKDWAAKKNYHLLNSKMPDWTEDDFRRVEKATAHDCEKIAKEMFDKFVKRLN